MRWYWRGDPTYSPENFGDVLVGDAIEALQQGEKLYQQDLHFQEIGMANLIALTRNVNRGKNDPASSAKDFYLFSSAPKRFEPVIADTVFSLTNDGKIEEWLLNFIPIDELRKVKKDGPPSNKRLFMGTAIALFCPSISEKVVSAKMVVYDDLYHWGHQWFTDIDTGDRYEIFVKPYDDDPYYELGWTGKLKQVVTSG